MTILFSANISERHRNRLEERYPKQTFIFCRDMEEAKEHLAQAEILVTLGEDLNAQLIGKAIRLKWIMVISAGVDQMPFREIERRGILVTNARGIHKTPMAEYVIAMLLQVYRQATRLMEQHKERKWDRSPKMKEISGSNMLILGTGAIGQEVARLAKAFQMTVNGVSRSGKQVPHFDQVVKMDQINEALPDADFIVSVLPSTEETRYSLQLEHFQSMKPSAVFLNMGRGDLVKSDIIIQALRDGEIAHAVLDVFEEEPLPSDHPLWEEENITITPHLSGVSGKYISRSIELFTENLDRYLAKESHLINKIDGKRGY